MLLAFAAAGGFQHGAIGLNGKPARLLPPAVDGPSQPAPVEWILTTGTDDGRTRAVGQIDAILAEDALARHRD